MSIADWQAGRRLLHKRRQAGGGRASCVARCSGRSFDALVFAPSMAGLFFQATVMNAGAFAARSAFAERHLKPNDRASHAISCSVEPPASASGRLHFTEVARRRRVRAPERREGRLLGRGLPLLQRTRCRVDHRTYLAGFQPPFLHGRRSHGADRRLKARAPSTPSSQPMIRSRPRTSASRSQTPPSAQLASKPFCPACSASRRCAKTFPARRAAAGAHQAPLTFSDCRKAACQGRSRRPRALRPLAPWARDRDDLSSRSKNSPFDGRKLEGPRPAHLGQWRDRV